MGHPETGSIFVPSDAVVGAAEAVDEAVSDAALAGRDGVSYRLLTRPGLSRPT